MPYLLCYTRRGEDRYRDINDSMHLALCEDGRNFVPLRNNTGVLFPAADFAEGGMAGTTKTLRHPWLFRFSGGKGGVLAVRFNNLNHPDAKTAGCVMVYQSENFVSYRLLGFLKLDDGEIANPRCGFDGGTGKYRVEWDSPSGNFFAWTEDFTSISDKSPGAGLAGGVFAASPAYDICGAVPGNSIEISADEAAYIKKMLGEVYNTGVRVQDLTLKTGAILNEQALPGAECLYSDGSVHRKAVQWDLEALRGIDSSRAGSYVLSGTVKQKIYPAPFITHAGDPCVFRYNDRFYFTSSAKEVILRVSDTLEGLKDARPIVIYQEDNAHFWAQELHYIQGLPYIFTSLCRDNTWSTVQSVILRCTGDPADPSAWEAPRYVLKRDGAMLNKDKGVCLDMTYFCVDGVHYAAWSGRDVDPLGDGRNEYGTNGPADIFIATIDPGAPWRLSSDPVCICRPVYGWERIETEVVEGPFLLRHGSDLFMTFSGASVGVVYAVGLLRAVYGSDLLNPASWDMLPYPILTSAGFPGQYGPGHNNFFKDPGNPDDDMIALLYRPGPEWIPGESGQEERNPRHAAIRRVHWNASGLPNLEMTPGRDLDPALAGVKLAITIED